MKCWFAAHLAWRRLISTAFVGALGLPVLLLVCAAQEPLPSALRK